MITGGLGGFGLALAEWLVQKGARNLVLTSKRGMRTGEQCAAVQRLHRLWGAKACCQDTTVFPMAKASSACLLVSLSFSNCPCMPGGLW